MIFMHVIYNSTVMFSLFLSLLLLLPLVLYASTPFNNNMRHINLKKSQYFPVTLFILFSACI